MSNIFFTSDQHWGHKNIIKYCRRPFSSVEEMDSEMIKRWNEKISAGDTVYFLGDFTLTSDSKYILNIFSQLNGDIKLISGNHDYWIAESGLIDIQTKNGQVVFLSPLYHLNIVHPVLTTPKGQLPIVLCHYSMRTWEMAHYGSWHLWGHSHGVLPDYGKSFDVGVDTNNFYPYSLDDITNKMATLSPIFDISKKKEWN